MGWSVGADAAIRRARTPFPWVAGGRIARPPIGSRCGRRTARLVVGIHYAGPGFGIYEHNRGRFETVATHASKDHD
jgi:hypothetical protein